ncbi:MAG: hypothetical protein ACXAEU_06510 [Candidatus Hodarchaeales archaeon]|jgi:hypothetical protein
MSYSDRIAGIGVKEVESEAMHRTSSEITALISRYPDRSYREATWLSFKDTERKYLTGSEVEASVLFENLQVENYLYNTLDLLKKTYSIAHQSFRGEIDKISTAKQFRDNWLDAKKSIPVAHLLAGLLGVSPKVSEKIPYLTGSVIDPDYRQYIMVKDYPLIEMYLRINNMLDKDIQQPFQALWNSLSHLDIDILEFYQEVYTYLTMNFNEKTSTINNILSKLTLEKLKKWKQSKSNDEFKSTLVSLFGSEETLRIELKYKGVITEEETVDKGLNRIKKKIDLPFDKIEQTKELRVHQTGIESAIEDIIKARRITPDLTTPLQRKRFIQSLKDPEKDIFFRNLSGLTMRQRVDQEFQQRGLNMNVSAMSSMELEDHYESLFGQHPSRTLINAIEDLYKAGKKVVGKVDTITTLTKIEKYLSKERSGKIKKIEFNETLKVKAIIRGLDDGELDEISKLVFGTIGGTRDDTLKAIISMIEDRDTYKSVGVTEAEVEDDTELKKGKAVVDSVIGTIIRYSITPAFWPMDMVLNFYNWLKDNVNDIFLASESPDDYRRYLGKRAVYKLVLESDQIFPSMDRFLMVGLFNSLFSKANITDIQKDLKNRSFFFRKYFNKDISFITSASSWTITNEIWQRHIARERREKIKDIKEIKKETPEERAMNAYKQVESALLSYTYSLSSKMAEITPLGIQEEEKIFNFLKYLSRFPEILDVPISFTMEGSKDSDTPSPLIDVIAQIIKEKDGRNDFGDKLKKLLKRVEFRRSFSDLEDLATLIIDLFNESLVGEKRLTVDRASLEKLRLFCRQHNAMFTRKRLEDQFSRQRVLDHILDKMVPEFFKLRSDLGPSQRAQLKGLLNNIFEDAILNELKNYTEALPFQRVKVEEKMARSLWGRGVKTNAFTIILNHLLQERTRGAAEIGIETWTRYSDKCRHILRRIDKTCHLIRGK